jgi:hypothetical protein
MTELVYYDSSNPTKILSVKFYKNIIPLTGDNCYNISGRYDGPDYSVIIRFNKNLKPSQRFNITFLSDFSNRADIYAETYEECFEKLNTLLFRKSCWNKFLDEVYNFNTFP